MTNCPNCGAPITADICEYCGTVVRKVSKRTVLYADNVEYLVETSDHPEMLETCDIDDIRMPSYRLAGFRTNS